ncbi:TRAP transporter substrate-binding protein [Roseobacter sp. HKCCA0434]|uniref:TRAP transporter substrate-binding protein n=1 Tax=Roseobacter sp. HKCCA0434 TaxID=3079297 RepID=UPI002905E9C6|nr:TRAP transporter substrate-binding protein [Roseobacter sp. HKCCA0434]
MTGMTRRGALLSGAFAATALAAPNVLKAQTLEFTMPVWVPPRSAVPYYILDPYFEIVSDVTGGRVRFRVGTGDSGPPPAQYERTRTGVSDLSFALHGYSGPDAFLRSQIGQFSFLGDSYGTSVVFSDIYRNILDADAEHEGVELLGLFTHGPGLIMTRDRRIETIGDLEGLRMRNSGGYIAQLLEQLGAESVAMPPGQIAAALDEGAIDGTALPYEALPAFGVTPHIGHLLEFPGGIYNATWFFVMNRDKWNLISDRDQRAIKEVSAEAIGPLAGKSFDHVDYLGKQDAEAAGIEIRRASDELIADIEMRGRAYERQWIERVAAQGFDAEYALTTLRRQTGQSQL